MTPQSQHSTPQFITTERGAALVVTLLVVVLFAAIITGFLAATRIETMASRNFAYQSIAEKMAYLGAERAIAQLNSANLTSANITNYISQPGRLTVNGTTMDLTSASLNPNPVTYVNLNQSQAIHTNLNTNLFSIPAVPNLITSGGNTTTNGRFAYWIDDDGTKANPNAMMPNRTNFLTTNSRPFSARAFSPTFQNELSNSITSTNSNELWGYFFTPLQAPGMSGALTNQIFQITAGPPNLTNTWAFSTNNRINLNGNLTTINVGGVSYGVNFLQNPQASTALTTELDDLITSRIDTTNIAGRFGRTFTQKYGADVLRQTLVNINDLKMSFSQSAATPAATTGSGNTNSDGIPLQYSGLQEFVFINEIACKAAYATNSPIPFNRVEFQIWFAVELLNPFRQPLGNGSQLKFAISDFSADVSYQLGGSLVSTNFSFGGQQPATGRQIPSDIEKQNFLPENKSFSGNLSFAIEYQSGGSIPMAASNVRVTRISFRPQYIKLLQAQDRDETIRDWAIFSDFSLHNNGQLTFLNPPLVGNVTKTSWDGDPDHLMPPPSTPADFNNFNTNSLGIAKNDPRVRRFPGWANPISAWFPVGGAYPEVTIGDQNTGVVDFAAPTGIQGINADRLSDTNVNIWDHPSFLYSANASQSTGRYNSLTELGKVHTGLQWRTLHMAAQSPTESSALIPDWALLDAFYINNSIPKLNINSFVYPAATNAAANTLAQQENAGLLKGAALESLLSGGTNMPVSDQIPADSRMRLTGANSYGTIARNIARMNYQTSWATRRAALGAAAFPANQYAMLGEVLEVANVANFASNDVVNEGRAASFIDALSLNSDVFSIYSVGYSMDRQGRDVGEFRLRTQVQLDRTTGRFRPVFTEPVRASNLPLP